MSLIEFSISFFSLKGHLKCIFTNYGFLSNDVVDTQKVGDLLKGIGLAVSPALNSGETIDQYVLRMVNVLRNKIPEVRKVVAGSNGN